MAFRKVDGENASGIRDIFNNGINSVFGAYGKAAAQPPVAIALTVVSIILCGVLIPGLEKAETVRNIADLYVQKGTRLDPELDFLNVNYGVSAQEFSISQVDGGKGNAMSANHFDALIHAWSPILKEDEVEKCPVFDGTGDTSKIEEMCKNPDYKKNSLYCQCETVAASPGQIKVDYINVDDPTDTKKDLSHKDMCDTPPVPTVFKAAVDASWKITEPEFAGATSKYSQLKAGALAAEAAKFANDKVYMASQAAWADIAFNALKGGEVALEEAAKAKEGRRRSTGKAGQWRYATSPASSALGIQNVLGASILAGYTYAAAAKAKNTLVTEGGDAVAVQTKLGQAYGLAVQGSPDGKVKSIEAEITAVISDPTAWATAPFLSELLPMLGDPAKALTLSCALTSATNPAYATMEAEAMVGSIATDCAIQAPAAMAAKVAEMTAAATEAAVAKQTAIATLEGQLKEQNCAAAFGPVSGNSTNSTNSTRTRRASCAELNAELAQAKASRTRRDAAVVGGVLSAMNQYSTAMQAVLFAQRIGMIFFPTEAISIAEGLTVAGILAAVQGGNAAAAAGLAVPPAAGLASRAQIAKAMELASFYGPQADDTTAATLSILAAVAQAAIGAQYNWVAEGNVIAQGYTRLTKCVANYAADNGARMTEKNFVANVVLATPTDAENPETPNAYTLSASLRPAVCLGDDHGVSSIGRAAAQPFLEAGLASGRSITATTADGSFTADASAFQLEVGGAYGNAILGSAAALLTGGAVDPYAKNLLNEFLATKLGAAACPKGLAEYVLGDGEDLIDALFATNAALTAALAAKTPELLAQLAAATTFMQLLATNKVEASIQGFIFTASQDPAAAAKAFPEDAAEYGCLLAAMTEASTKGASFIADELTPLTSILGLALTKGPFADAAEFAATAKAALKTPDADAKFLYGKAQVFTACSTGAVYALTVATIADRLARGNPNANGTLTSQAHFSQKYWQDATVGHTAEPLPRKWGVDRFPCGRAASMDLFREGDFDYPYALKQLQEVSYQTLMFGASPFYAAEAAQAKCVDNAVIKPIQEALYLQAMLYDYTAANMAAIDAAETEFVAKVGNDVLAPGAEADARRTAAGGAAGIAYVANGGNWFHAASARNLLGDEIKGASAAAVGGAAATAFGAVLTQKVNPADAAGLPTLAAIAYGVMTGDAGGETTPANAQKFGLLVATKKLGYYDATVAVKNTALTVADVAGFGITMADAQRVSAALTIARLVPMAVPWLTTLATSFGSAVGYEQTLLTSKNTCGVTTTGQLDTAVQLFATMGYKWRKSYGSHWSSTEATKADVMDVADGAFKAYARTFPKDAPFNPMMCVNGNTDYEQLQGEPINGCLLPWVPLSALPPDLMMGAVEFNKETGTRAELANSGLKKVRNHRVVVNLFSAFHWMQEAKMNDLTGTETTYASRDNLIFRAEAKYRDHLKPCFDKTPGTEFGPGEKFEKEEFFFTVDRGTGDVVEEGTETEMAQLVIVYLVVILYIAAGLFSYSDNNLSHAVVGIIGVCVMACATASALGLAAWFGIGWTPLSNNVAPFIMLGIGIDDMLVMAHSYAHNLAADKSNKNKGTQPKQYHTGDNAGIAALFHDTLAEVGPSITYTSTCNLLAFMLASLIQITVVQYFCYMMAIGIVVNYIFLFMFFLPVLRVDAHRVVVMKAADLLCMPAKTVEDPTNDHVNAVTGFMENYYGPLITHKASKAVIVVGGLVFFCIQFWQFAEYTNVGIRNTDITKDGTYQNEFYNKNELYFGMYTISLPVRATDWGSTGVQVNVQLAAKALPQGRLIEKSDMGVGTGSSWIQSVIAAGPPDCISEFTVNASHANNSACDFSKSETMTQYKHLPPGNDAWYKAFGAYLNGLGALSAANYVCKHKDADGVLGKIVPCFDVADAYKEGGKKDIVLVAATTTVYVKDQLTIDNFLDGIKDSRSDVDGCYDQYPTAQNKALGITEGAPYGLTADDTYWTYPTGYSFKYYCQYLYSFDDMYKTVGFTSLGIFIASVLFSLSWQSSVCLVFTIFKTFIEVAAIIPESDVSLETGLKLNAFSLVNLCICVGMTVEFTGHIVREFLVVSSKEENKGPTWANHFARNDDRVVKALGALGAPVIHGIVASLITTAFIALSNTAFIRQYYFFMFFFMIIIATANGMLFLPVLLTFFGDAELNTHSAKRKMSILTGLVMDGQTSFELGATVYSQEKHGI